MSRTQRRKINEAIQRGGVFVGYVHPDDNDSEFQNCLLATVWHDARNRQRLVGHGGYIHIGSGPRIASSRNKVVRNFLNLPPSARWLWMVDTDMTFPPDLLYRMLDCAEENDLPLLGGLAFAGGKGPFHYPTLYGIEVSDEGHPVAHRLEDFPEDSLVEVDGTGAACLLIRRDVLETVGEKWSYSAYPWFAETEHNKEEFGEDITFCLRARQAGFSISVHTGIVVGHRKKTILDLNSYKQQNFLIEQLGREELERAYLERFVTPELVT